MKRFLLPFLVLSICSYGQISLTDLPKVDWSTAGHKEVKHELIGIDFKKELEISGLSCDDQMDSILVANPNGARIFFEEGTYTFMKQIRLKSNFILEGKGAAKTTLVFDLTTEMSPILISGRATGEMIALSSPVSKGETEIHFETTDLTKYPLIDVGEKVLLLEDDKELIESDWAHRKTGQVFNVVRVGMEGIEVENEARRTYNMLNKPMLMKIVPIENVGIERLRIENKRKTSGQTSNIHFNYASNCWVKHINSQNANYSHVLLEFSNHCTVQSSTFQRAFDYGNGGKGYGVTLQFATSDCLIIGNRLTQLRHAILLQAGANGNVIHANKAYGGRWDGVFLPKDSAGDIVLHGNYVYANLIQTNMCDNLVIDNSHGANGPDNVVFNNKIGGYGLFMNAKSVDGKIYLINNVIENDKGIKGKYRIKKKLVVATHNQVKGKVIPRDSEPLKVESLWK